MMQLRSWWGTPHRDILAGLVVAFAMIPEAIAFSGIAGVDPRVGLFQGLLKVCLSRRPARSLTGFFWRHPPPLDPCQRHPSRALLQPRT